MAGDINYRSRGAAAPGAEIAAGLRHRPPLASLTIYSIRAFADFFCQASLAASTCPVNHGRSIEWTLTKKSPVPRYSFFPGAINFYGAVEFQRARGS